MEQIPLVIAGAQLGVTICSLGLGAIAEPALSHLLEGPFESIGLPEAAVHPVSFVLALIVVVFAHTVIGEMVPKNITLAGPERAVLWLGAPMLAFCIATKPLLVAMKWASRQILRIWRVEATDAVKTVFTTEELANLVAESRTEGLLDQEEHARLAGALMLHASCVGDVAVPWSDVTTVADNISPAALEALASRTGRSRFPVVERATQRVLGFVHVKDVLGMVGPARRTAIDRSLVRAAAGVATGAIAGRGAGGDAPRAAPHRAGPRWPRCARRVDPRRRAQCSRRRVAGVVVQITHSTQSIALRSVGLRWVACVATVSLM